MGVLVLDNGAGCTKVGFSTSKEPKYVLSKSFPFFFYISRKYHSVHFMNLSYEFATTILSAHTGDSWIGVANDGQ